MVRIEWSNGVVPGQTQSNPVKPFSGALGPSLHHSNTPFPLSSASAVLGPRWRVKWSCLLHRADFCFLPAPKAHSVGHVPISQFLLFPSGCAQSWFELFLVVFSYFQLIRVPRHADPRPTPSIWMPRPGQFCSRKTGRLPLTKRRHAARARKFLRTNQIGA